MQKDRAVESSQPGEVLHDFGEKMKAARNKTGIPQAKLQALLMDGFGIKIDTSGITRMEAGQREPRLSEALAIASVLGLDLSDLASGDRDLHQQLADIAELLSRTREDVAALLQAADQIAGYVEANPDSIGGRRLGDLIGQVVDSCKAVSTLPTPLPPKVAATADRLKRQLLSAVSAKPSSEPVRGRRR